MAHSTKLKPGETPFGCARGVIVLRSMRSPRAVDAPPAAEVDLMAPLHELNALFLAQQQEFEPAFLAAVRSDPSGAQAGEFLVWARRAFRPSSDPPVCLKRGVEELRALAVDIAAARSAALPPGAGRAPA